MSGGRPAWLVLDDSVSLGLQWLTNVRAIRFNLNKTKISCSYDSQQKLIQEA